MRPRRLELEGFTSFRERVCIDFEDADLFVLSGPMGAGKSSVIDAMGFALYGNIARFHSKSLVAPIISQGLQETKVQLDFQLGEHEYTAIRVVRRNPRTGGASTPEARLLEDGKLIADNADQVTEQIQKLFGLTFEQFTKCVVLPQGDFADLLHAKPAERQELLVQLLDIGLYRRIGERARSRASRGEGMLIQLRTRLENELRNINQAAYDEQEKRVAALAELLVCLEADEGALLQLASQAEVHRAAVASAGKLLLVLQAVTVPPGLDALISKIQDAEAAEKAAAKREQEVSVQVQALEKQQAELPEPGALEGLMRDYKEQAEIKSRITAAEKTLTSAEARLDAGEKEAASARAALEAAQAELARLERADSAYHASQGLKIGDICPVCGEKLTAAPVLQLPAGVKAADAALRKVRQEQEQLEAENRKTSEGIIKLKAAIDGEAKRLTALAEHLEGKPPAKEIANLIQKVRKAESDLTSSRQLERMVRQAHEAAQRALAEAQGAEQQAWTRLHNARAQVAAAGAPEFDGNLEEGWRALSTWAQNSAVQQASLKQEAETEAAGLAEKEQMLRARQALLCEAAGVHGNGRSFRDAALEARVTAEEELKAIDRRLTERIGVEQEMEGTAKSTNTAKLLGTHLNATHFERWYLQEAMSRLVAGATERMKDLTDGQYSIDLNHAGSDFVVIDHLNANEARPVRTLSGGETFLASLALALALGDDIAALAAKGSSRLDALFLDEGFGSLDQTTLETVSSTIEELGARGRMVGIITHVQELADRVPVQFRVSKVNGSSQVERVER